MTHLPGIEQAAGLSSGDRAALGELVEVSEAVAGRNQRLDAYYEGEQPTPSIGIDNIPESVGPGVRSDWARKAVTSVSERVRMDGFTFSGGYKDPAFEAIALDNDLSGAYNRIVVITTGGSDIASMEDLDGRTTANTLGSSYATLAESHGATNTGVDDFNQTIQLLQQGRIDATLNDEVVFYDYMAQHPDADLKIAAENDEPTHVAFPLRREEATEGLLDAVNAAIETLRGDGTLAELSNEFFGIDITEA